MSWVNIGYVYPETMDKLYDQLRLKGWSHTGLIFRKMRRNGYQFSEPDLNNYGYTLLKQRKFNCALVMLKQNINWFPKNGSVYDSCAEAFMDAGHKNVAKKTTSFP